MFIYLTFYGWGWCLSCLKLAFVRLFKINEIQLMDISIVRLPNVVYWKNHSLFVILFMHGSTRHSQILVIYVFSRFCYLDDVYYVTVACFIEGVAWDTVFSQVTTHLIIADVWKAF